MKNLKFYSPFLCLLFFSFSAQSQTGLPSCLSKSTLPFNECAAIFLNDKMVVSDYSPGSKCKVPFNATGNISVSTIELNLNAPFPYQSVGFKVAIHNHRTNTIWLYSEETFQSIDIKSLIDKCGEGDSIILLTVDKNFALPHNTIEIQWGC